MDSAKTQSRRPILSASQEARGAQSKVGALQIGVILLALATGLMHFYLFLVEGFLGSGTMLPIYQLLFVLILPAYGILAVALYLPSLGRYQRLVRALLMSVAVTAFASYLYVGVFDLYGDVNKAIEILLFALLAVDAGTRGRGVLDATLQIMAGVVVGIVLFLILLATVMG